MDLIQRKSTRGVRPSRYWAAVALLGAMAVVRPSLAAQGRKDCEEGLTSSPRSYANLERLDDELSEAILAARAKVEERLGWMPAIKRTNLPVGLSDVKLFKPGAEMVKENAIAFLSFQIDGDTLQIELTFVNKKFRSQGLSELMLGEILAANPGITRISVGDLQQTNAEIFYRAFEKMGCKKAIRKTPAFKSIALFGFFKFVDAECKTDQKTYEICDKGQKFQMCYDPPRISFTLKRP